MAPSSCGLTTPLQLQKNRCNCQGLWTSIHWWKFTVHEIDQIGITAGVVILYNIHSMYFTSFYIVNSYHEINSQLSICQMSTKRVQVVPMPMTVTTIASPAKKNLFVAPSSSSRAMNDTAIKYMHLFVQTVELP